MGHSFATRVRTKRGSAVSHDGGGGAKKALLWRGVAMRKRVVLNFILPRADLVNQVAGVFACQDHEVANRQGVGSNRRTVAESNVAKPRSFRQGPHPAGPAG